MANSDVKVTFSAEDQATEVARKLLDTLRALDRQQKATASSAAAVAKPATEAATAFQKMQVALGQLGKSNDLSDVTRGVALLSQGLRSATTQAQSLARLTEAELQLQRALRAGNLTLEQRINLERTLRQTQAAIAGGGSVSGLATGVEAAVAGLSKLQNVLGALGIAFSIAQTLQFGKGLIDAADAMNDLSKTTGISTESLSVFEHVAEQSGATVDTLEVGFRTLSKQVEALRSGNQEAAATFGALGITAQSIKGLGLEQIFLKIADAQQRFDDGTGKITVATRLFGRSGEELIQTLHALANGGFDRTRQELTALGGVLSGEAGKAADDFNDQLKNARAGVTGLARDLVVSVLPPLTQFARDIATITTNIREGIAIIPEWARVIGHAAAEIAVAGAKGVALGATLGPAGIQLAIRGAGERIGQMIAKLIGLRDAANEAGGALGRVAAPNAGAAEPKLPPLTLIDPAQQKAAREAELAALRQHIRDQLAILQSGERQKEQITDAGFAANLSSIGEHFARRLDITRAGTAAEIKAINDEIKAVQATPLPENTLAARTQREAELSGLVAQRQRLEIDGQTQVNALVEQRRVAEKQAVIELGQLQAQLFQAQGQDLKAAQIEIKQAADRFAESLTAKGFGTQLIADLRAAFSTLFTDIAAFQSQSKAAEREFQGLAIDRAKVEQAVATGILSQREGIAANIALEQARIPALQAAANAVKFFADRVKDPALQLAAQQLQQQINAIGHATLQSTKLISEFKDSLLEAGRSAFSQLLGDDLNKLFSDTEARSKVRTLTGEIGAAQQELQGLLRQPVTPESQQAISALRTEIRGLQNDLDNTRQSLVTLGGIALDFLKGMVAQVQRLLAEIISNVVFEKIGSIFGLGINNGSAALAKAGIEVQKGGAAVAAGAAALLAAAITLKTVSGIQAGIGAVQGVLGASGFASGGYVRGPGTGTSDSILTRLSAGEFVIRAAVVDKLGVPFLNALNGLKTPRIRSLDSVGVPRFADGGLVTVQQGVPAKAKEDALHLTIEHSEDTIVRVIAGTKGVRALTRLMQANKSQFRAALA